MSKFSDKMLEKRKILINLAGT